VKVPSHHRVRAVSELLTPGRPLLDAGSGTELLARQASGGIVSVDIDRSSSGPNVLGDVHALPFRDGAFAAAVCVSVLQYVVDVDRAIDELARVTQPGGQVVILVPNLAYARNVGRLVLGRFPWSSALDDWSGGTVRYFTVRDLRRLVESKGLGVDKVACSGRGRRLRSKFVSALGADIILAMSRP
jgi:SAM-dependent methyltransferase